MLHYPEEEPPLFAFDIATATSGLAWGSNAEEKSGEVKGKNPSTILQRIYHWNALLDMTILDQSTAPVGTLCKSKDEKVIVIGVIRCCRKKSW